MRILSARGLSSDMSVELRRPMTSSSCSELTLDCIEDLERFSVTLLSSIKGHPNRCLSAFYACRLEA